MELQLHLFMTSALYRGEWLTSQCGHFAPHCLYPLTRNLGVPRSRFGLFHDIYLTCAGIRALITLSLAWCLYRLDCLGSCINTCLTGKGREVLVWIPPYQDGIQCTDVVNPFISILLRLKIRELWTALSWLKRLIAREYFVAFSRCEKFKFHKQVSFTGS